MSYDKFAPMTSALLARKGEAAPSPIVGQRVPVETETRARKSKARSQKRTKVPSGPSKKVSSKSSMKRGQRKAAGAAKRRIVLTLTQEEFERVEAAGRKRKNTPQQLVRNALFVYLSAIKA